MTRKGETPRVSPFLDMAARSTAELTFWNSQEKLRKGGLRVKGGTLTLSAVRDFASVIKGNDAIMGLLIAQQDPTKEMRLVCEQQGYAEWESAKKYPKMQIRTVKDLLENPKNPFETRMPPDSREVRESARSGLSKASFRWAGNRPLIESQMALRINRKL